MMPILLLALMVLLALGVILTTFSKIDKNATNPPIFKKPRIFKAGDRVVFNSYYRKYDIVIRQGTQATVIDATQTTIPDATYGSNVIISIDGMPFEMMVPAIYLENAVENEHELQYNK